MAKKTLLSYASRADYDYAVAHPDRYNRPTGPRPDAPAGPAKKVLLPYASDADRAYAAAHPDRYAVPSLAPVAAASAGGGRAKAARVPTAGATQYGPHGSPVGSGFGGVPNAYGGVGSGRGGAPNPFALTRGQTADAARYQAQADALNKTGLTRGQIGDAARYTAQAISYNKFPNLMSPQIASAMGLSETDRTALGYDANWPYTRSDPLVTGGGGGGVGGGGGGSGGGALSRAGGGRPAVDYFGGGNIGLVNWRI